VWQEANATSYHFSFPSEFHGEGLSHRPVAALEHSPSPARKGKMFSSIVQGYAELSCVDCPPSAHTHSPSRMEPQAASDRAVSLSPSPSLSLQRS